MLEHPSLRGSCRGRVPHNPRAAAGRRPRPGAPGHRGCACRPVSFGAAGVLAFAGRRATVRGKCGASPSHFVSSTSARRCEDDGTGARGPRNTFGPSHVVTFLASISPPRRHAAGAGPGWVRCVAQRPTASPPAAHGRVEGSASCGRHRRAVVALTVDPARSWPCPRHAGLGHRSPAT